MTTRFKDIIESLKPKGRSGLDTFGTDKCDLCGVTFDPKDAKYWSRETDKVHYRCYSKWKEAH